MSKDKAESAFPTPNHNHARCLNEAIEKAKKIFLSRKLKLTPLREQIYRQILTSHKAVGAYDILDRMRHEGREIAPITAYRILDLLDEMGLIHRLELQNAYYACFHDHTGDKNFITLICRKCGAIAELMDQKINHVFDALEKQVGFTKEKRILEVVGLCQRCHKDGGEIGPDAKPKPRPNTKPKKKPLHA